MHAHPPDLHVRTHSFPTRRSSGLTTALPGSTQADVLVIGGGYAGLSTALHLAERGIDTLLLEAREIGFGGSGRNGGQVIPGLKYDPDDLVRMYGAERGERLAQFAGGTADMVFGLIERQDRKSTRLNSSH